MTDKQRVALAKRIIGIFENVLKDYPYHFYSSSIRCAIRYGNNFLSGINHKFIGANGEAEGGEYTSPILYKAVDKTTYNLMCKYNSNFGKIWNDRFVAHIGAFQDNNEQVNISRDGRYSQEYISNMPNLESCPRLTYDEFVEYRKHW